MKKLILFLICFMAVGFEANAQKLMTYVGHFDEVLEKRHMDSYYYPLPNVECEGGGPR